MQPDDVTPEPKSQKRRRSTAEDSGQPAKKSKGDKKARTEDKKEDKKPRADKASEPTAVPLRDREHLTVIVKNLPPGTADVKVRRFFRDCGTINAIKTVTDPDGEAATASVEFDAKEDVLAAKTRDQKAIDGRTVTVTEGTGATLYATNFPPTADEAYIRGLFKEVRRCLLLCSAG